MQHRHGPETAHGVADTSQSEVFGCIPHGPGAYARAPVRCAGEALLLREALPKASHKGLQRVVRELGMK